MRRGLSLLLLLFAAAAPSSFPPVPPLPATGWPAAAAAEPFARALIARVPAQALAQLLAAQPEAGPAILRNFGTAMVSADPALREAAGRYAREVVQQSAHDDLQRLTALTVVDPQRYLDDGAFRARIDLLLPRTLAALPRASARAVLAELTSSAALDFDTAERAAAAAHLVPRESTQRRIDFDRTLQLPDDLAGPIEASIFSLSTASFAPDEARRFLQAVHAASPARRIVVLGDGAMRAALEPDRERLHLALLDDLARPFTPWPRDPFIVARSPRGGVVFVNRPNVQPHREEDQNMVRAIVDALPSSLDQAWRPRWTVAPVPFHNGHILRTPATAWISIHSVEPRALALLGAERVPAETFGDRAAVERYVAAVRRAATELSAFYGCPVRFVHDLPSGDGAPAQMARLAGGAGVDLDSIVTLLPRAGGKSEALVGDVALGVALARATDWAAAHDAYGFRHSAAQLGARMAEAQSAPATAALQQYLDEIAASLRRAGMTVRRLPLLSVPATMLSRTDTAAGTTFLITWNNVVLEKRGAVRRAEGFASLLPLGDAAAAQAFGAAGYRLDLFPPLVRSVIFGGGYRCASNHLRP